MPIYQLDNELWFPPVSKAEPDGLLALGGDLSAERIILAYESGIFPFYSENEPILWWSPNPRFVLFPEKLKVSDSMKQVLKKNIFQISFNEAFEAVMSACAEVKRKGQDSTWILPEMIEAYTKLHKLGLAHSIEVWQERELVGGLYGIKIGKVFFGESMFSKVSNASKAGFITFVNKEKEMGLRLIDCQLHTAHLESLGAEMIPREDFIKQIKSLG